MVNINKYIKALLHPAGGHQGSHKAHQAGNQVLLYSHFQRHSLDELFVSWNILPISGNQDNNIMCPVMWPFWIFVLPYWSYFMRHDIFTFHNFFQNWDRPLAEIITLTS